MEYTKGDWYWENPFEDEVHKYHNLRSKIESGDSHILYTHGGVRTFGDAHLIAAAPALYEALQGIVADLENIVQPYILERTFEALAKAEGK